ncbi:MAG: tetratricopeptide repeat protein [Nannocystaceae bacterium]
MVDDASARERLEEAAYAAAALGDHRLYAIAAAALAAALELRDDDHAGAEAWIHHASATLGRLGDDPEAESLIAWIDGGLLARRGRLDAALPRLERAYERARAAHGPRGLPLARIAPTLALVRRGLGQRDAALALLHEAAAIVEAQIGPRAPGLAPIWIEEASTLAALDRPEEALALLDRARGLDLRADDERPPLRLRIAEARRDLLRSRGAIAPAIEAAAEATALREAEGDAHPSATLALAMDLAAEASLLLEAGEAAAAELRLRRALDLEARLYTDHESAAREDHERLRALLSAAELALGRPAAAPSPAVDRRRRVRVVDEFSDVGLLGAEVCVDGGACLESDADGQVVFETWPERQDLILRIRLADRLPVVLAVRAGPSPTSHEVALYRRRSAVEIATGLGLRDDPTRGHLLAGVEGPALDPVRGATLSLAPAAGDGPFYLSELGAFDRSLSATGVNSRGAVAWIGLPPGRYDLSARHPELRCEPALEAWPAATGGAIALVIEAGAITRVPDFRCSPAKEPPPRPRPRTPAPR